MDAQILDLRTGSVTGCRGRGVPQPVAHEVKARTERMTTRRYQEPGSQRHRLMFCAF